MAKPENHQSVTAVVAAYNEAARIGSVLTVLCQYSGLEEIIVVDDGSTDDTATVAKRFNIRYVKNVSNRGKGFAMDRGVSLAKSDTIFFCDADVLGLTTTAIEEIIRPVALGTVELSIGMRDRKLYFAHQITAFVPLLGGERALTKALWQKVPLYYKDRFKIEAALNFYALYYGNGFQYKVFRGLTQVIKEKKYGLLPGLQQRCHMIVNIVVAQLKLHMVHVPPSRKNLRRLAIIALQSLIGISVALFLFAAIYFGPNTFVRALFAEELREDPTAPIANALLNLSQVSTIGTIALIAAVLLLSNTLTFLFTFENLTYWVSGLLYKVKSNKSD